MSVTQMFSRCAPSETSRLRQASAAAPAPDATILTSDELLAGQPQRVEDGRGDDDRGAVLVVMEDRDLHALLAAAPRSRSIPAP